MAIPLLYNPNAGSAKTVCELLAHDKRILLTEAPAGKMAQRVREAIEAREPRILVCGGDGSLALAASELAGTKTELAVIPGGTLNHFAQRLGIPDSPEEALNLALQGKAEKVDVGYVNDKMFINTCSVGAYPVFVRTREYLENRMGYLTASLFAGVRRLIRFRNIRIQIDEKKVRSPLVFVGVLERELLFPFSGKVKDDGQRGFHVIAVDCSSRLETFRLILPALLLGKDIFERQRKVSSRIMHSFELTFHNRKRRVHLALDGELVRLHSPLVYRYAPESVRVVSGVHE